MITAQDIYNFLKDRPEISMAKFCQQCGITPQWVRKVKAGKEAEKFSEKAAERILDRMRFLGHKNDATI